MKKNILNLFYVILVLNNCSVFGAGLKENIIDKWIEAGSSGDLETVKKLATQIDDVNIGDEYKFTALMAAAARGAENVVSFLLSLPTINVNAKDKMGRTALHFAAGRGEENIAKLLLQKPDIDVNIKARAGITPLMEAVSNKNENVIKLLLQVPGIDVNALESIWKSTPLHVAVIVGVKDSQRHQSIDQSANIIKLLLEAGANPFIRDSTLSKKTALDQSKDDSKFMSIVEKLINNALEKRAVKLIEAAKLSAERYEEASRIIENLVKIGVNINAQDELGITALMWAVSRNNKRLVELLLKLGADRKIKNNHNETAAEIARTAGFEDIAELLEKTEP